MGIAALPNQWWLIVSEETAALENNASHVHVTDLHSCAHDLVLLRTLEHAFYMNPRLPYFVSPLRFIGGVGLHAYFGMRGNK